MDDDQEIDWGNEDDEMGADFHRTLSQQKGGSGGEDRREPEDAEDAVSLGGEEDDMQEFSAYQSRAQQDPTVLVPKATSKSQSSSNQSRRDLQREDSGTSQKTPLRPRSPKQSSGSPEMKRSRSSQSHITHALPPKPMVAPAVRSPPQSSLMEASAMATSMGRGKRQVNGTLHKPIPSGEDSEPLPPDWEAKRPRSGSGVYYYNQKAQISTWTRPTLSSNRSPSRDRDSKRITTTVPVKRADDDRSSDRPVVRASKFEKTPHRGSPPPLGPPPLSYEDRHYKPTQKTVSPEPTVRRDDGYKSPPTFSQGSYPVSTSQTYQASSRRSPRPDRPEQQVIQPLRPRRGDSFRDDSVRSIPNEQGVRKVTQSDNPRTSASAGDYWHSGPDSHPGDWSPLELSMTYLGREYERAMEERNFLDVRMELSSTPRRRSPPPVRERPTSSTRPFANATDSTSPVTATQPHTRPRTRFDRPTSPPLEVVRQSRPQQREWDSNVPPSTVPRRRSRERELPAEPNNGEVRPKRPRVEHSASATSGRIPGAASPIDRHTSDRTSASVLGAQEEQSHSKKRTPLPPQSARFQEMLKLPAPMDAEPPLPPARPPTQPPSAPSRSTNVGNVPAGPRRGLITQASQESNYFDFGQGPRHPPSGQPTIPNAPAVRSGDRRVVEPTLNRGPASHEPPERGFPSSRSFDTSMKASMKANEGMYADREPTESLPKGPRAMAVKINTSGFPTHSVSPLTSPQTPFTPSQRPFSAQEPVSKNTWERSPPHASGGNGYRLRILPGMSAPVPEKFLFEDVLMRQFDEPRERSQDQLQERQSNGLPADIPRAEGRMDRRELPPHQASPHNARRQSDAFPKVSGGSSAPLVRKEPYVPPSAKEWDLPSAPSGPRHRSSAVGDRSVHATTGNDPRNESFEHLQPSYSRGVPTVNSREIDKRSSFSGPSTTFAIGYEPSHGGERGRGRGRDNPKETSQSNAGPGGRGLFTPTAEPPARVSRFDRGTVTNVTRGTEPRIWLTNEQYADPMSTPKVGYKENQHDEYRAATPPPTSGERSWDSSFEERDRNRQVNRATGNLPSYNNGSRQGQSPEADVTRPHALEKDRRIQTPRTESKRAYDTYSNPERNESGYHAPPQPPVSPTLPRQQKRENQSYFDEDRRQGQRKLDSRDNRADSRQQVSAAAEWDKSDTFRPSNRDSGGAFAQRHVSPVHIHPSRARMIQQLAPSPAIHHPLPQREESPPRTSKPVRIRRPPMSPAETTTSAPMRSRQEDTSAPPRDMLPPAHTRPVQHSDQGGEQDSNHNYGRGYIRDEPPHYARGGNGMSHNSGSGGMARGSLLDRLSNGPLDVPPIVSLRDRVELPQKRSREEMSGGMVGEDYEMGGMQIDEGGMDPNYKSTRSGGKRRNSRGKRGRGAGRGEFRG